MHLKIIASIAIMLLVFPLYVYADEDDEESDLMYQVMTENSLESQQEAEPDDQPDYNYTDYNADFSSESYYEEEIEEQAPPRKLNNDVKIKSIEKKSDSRLPDEISPQGEKTIVIDPKVHAFGAYTADGKLIYSGLATSGANWCSDTGRPCRTKVGSFRIFSLGDSTCISSRYPLGEGGAPMPYCMFFNGNQGIHGSNQVTDGNISHGCVRISVGDAAWLRYEFAQHGTKVIVKPYD